jgi:excisionase family DNA binding protein
LDFDNLPDIITPKQLSDYLQVSVQTVKRAIKDKKLEAFKVNRDWRIEKKAVLKWIGKEK